MFNVRCNAEGTWQVQCQQKIQGSETETSKMQEGTKVNILMGGRWFAIMILNEKQIDTTEFVARNLEPHGVIH